MMKINLFQVRWESGNFLKKPIYQKTVNFCPKIVISVVKKQVNIYLKRRKKILDKRDPYLQLQPSESRWQSTQVSYKTLTTL